MEPSGPKKAFLPSAYIVKGSGCSIEMTGFDIKIWAIKSDLHL